jgi:hypothetical protein
MNSNNQLARAAGFLYLIMIITGGFAEAFVREGLTVYGDAVTTAQNILAAEQIYRFGFVADLVCLICGTFLSIIFYILFKLVNRNLSLLALIFSITKEPGKLFLQAPGQEKLEMFAETEAKFFLKVNDAQFEFVRDDSGKMTKVIMQQGGRADDAKKIK